ncbi:bacteriocin immunity protein [Streptococcus dysgalactiae subsp. dysgalactiae]|uniref:bacteriocin immunity protein n=1 Tax=Streptococcus TaxID=1301 RepID=UPI000617A9B7|nr:MULTISPECIES: bacteriocin immunity protein [Streptococcus]KKC20665.1 enterocin immunity protein [Streptococcus dysgalactiae subsp. equisimilis]KKC23265.1 enterocin immunity protein [Streptococcus dysgalactiae subsp. equisimilis]MBM6514037.1 bacteriocin immunity protein [Streptococcus dysgalactiae subsp. equisimilis]MBM6533464.1 bacteriocin immunity protein [Streptococcus dysgalactiae subsp. equisimilis]MBM6548245.1 bacteriocin immunity protein [Streptococcus dysgalactiae subsp. equisimilis]
MEKKRRRLYDVIRQAYDYPENRENIVLSQLFLSASNKLIKQSNPLVIAHQLNQDLDHYLLDNDLLLPKSLCPLKKALENYILEEVSSV